MYMKKSLIALAVLAASGAAMAQSSVTLYGIADVVVHKDKNKSTTMTSGGVSASRFGFKGTEDLGGGLKAEFVLEQGFDLVTGDQSIANKAFSRESSVGLSGSFGSVKLGRMATAFDTNEGAGFAAFYSVLNPANEWVGYTSGRHDNGIYYASPEFGGFSADLSFNLAGAAARHTAVVLKYSNGPVYAAFLHQKDKANTEKQNRIEVTYDFGLAKALFAYDKIDQGGVDAKQYSLGADVPVSDQLTLSGGLASTKTVGATRVNGWSLAAAYSLSKRTTVYGGYYGDNGAAGAGTLKSRYGIGVKHTF
jgi:predicted porin